MTQAGRLLRHGSSFAAGRTILTHRPSASVLLPAVSSGSSFSPLTRYRRHQYRHYQGAAFQKANLFSAASAIAASGALLGGSLLGLFGENNNTSISVIDEENDDELPTYTMAQVSNNNGKGADNRVWMTYGGCVYDATDFIANHPGGSEKILLAAGGPIEPHWNLYRQHFASDLPLQLMEKMLIGHLHPDDQEKVDDDMEQLENSSMGGDPYEHEPIRSPLLKVHNDTPMNAEVPMDILGREYITPADTFYIRSHHPVPLLSEKEVEDFRLDVDLTLLSKATSMSGNDAKQKQTAKLSLAQIKSLAKVEVTTTLQCSGNRRSGFNDFRMTSGTPWGQGAISTAKWGGARLVDVLMLASAQLPDDKRDSTLHQSEKDTTSTNTSNDKGNLLQTLQNLRTILDEHPNLQHLRFESLDGMLASIDILKALSPFGDVIIAYEMNDEPLPRDHGYPLRVIVPGYAAVRNAKWLSKLELAEEQAEGSWQRGLNYKVLPPSVVDANEVDLDRMPGIAEVSIFSGITNVHSVDVKVSEEQKKMVPGETVMVKASGWAWAGGGRNIVRVDITGDNGKSWSNGNLTQGSNQPYGRAWAWVFWECPAVPAIVCEDGITVELSCKAVDTAFNSQPGSSDGLWNVRGLANNSWFRLRHRVL